MVHVLAYDLTTPNDTSEDYKRVIDAITMIYSAWAHIEQSVWLIDTSLDAENARDALLPYLYAEDVLFVARLSGNWGTKNAQGGRVAWLKERVF